VSSSLLGVPWPTIIAGGIALLLVAIIGAGMRAILRGDLVPRSVLADANARADKWEQAWDKSEARLDQFDGRLTALSEGTELNTQLLSSLMNRSTR
jgi:hypothetical protein